MTPTNHKRKILHSWEDIDIFFIYDSYLSTNLGEEGEEICYSLTEKNYNELLSMKRKLDISVDITLSKFIRKNQRPEEI